MVKRVNNEKLEGTLNSQSFKVKKSNIFKKNLWPRYGPFVDNRLRTRLLNEFQLITVGKGMSLQTRFLIIFNAELSDNFEYLKAIDMCITVSVLYKSCTQFEQLINLFSQYIFSFSVFNVHNLHQNDHQQCMHD